MEIKLQSYLLVSYMLVLPVGTFPRQLVHTHTHTHANTQASGVCQSIPVK